MLYVMNVYNSLTNDNILKVTTFTNYSCVVN